MAAIDKIYGNKFQAEEIILYLKKVKDDIKARCGYDCTKWVYDLSWDDWDVNNKEYNPESVHPITNFPQAIDCALAQRDDLPKHMEEEMRDQYGDTFDEMKNAVGKGGRYDFEKWIYDAATKFRIDWTDYRFYDKGFNHLCLAQKCLLVDAHYFGEGNMNPKYGTTIWFVEKCFSDTTEWVCDNFEFKCRCGLTSNYAHPKIYTLKSLIRWCRKMKFPKGTVLTVCTGYVGGDFKIYCK